MRCVQIIRRTGLKSLAPQIVTHARTAWLTGLRIPIGGRHIRSRCAVPHRL